MNKPKRIFAVFAFITLIALLSTSALAMQLRLGETKTEMVGGTQVSITFVGLNTQRDAGAAFFSIDGKTHIIENGTLETFGDLKVALTKVDIYSNQSGGIAYLTLLRESSCKDAVKNGAETDIDCGGPCGLCEIGKKCASSIECSSRICEENICIQGLSCQNERRDGSETDIDCGGTCSSCAIGKRCNNGGDCKSAICTGFLCAPAQQRGTCFDGIKNGDEQGADCGGTCPTDCSVTRNITTFCGEGCFFLNNECSCQGKGITKNQTETQAEEKQAQNKPEIPNWQEISPTELARIQLSSRQIKEQYHINISTIAYINQTRQVIVNGSREGKLFGLISVKVPFEALVYVQNSTISKTQTPRWAFMVKYT